MARHVITTYFTRPNYLRVGEKPWFSFYEIGSFVAGLGGIDQAADALAWFDAEARRAGLGGVHVDAVVWGFEVLPASEVWPDPGELIARLGFSSATSYVWLHHVNIDSQPFPSGDWDQVHESAFREYESYATQLPVPFHPNVTVGWGASPRTRQDVPFERSGYPWWPTWDPSPAQFRVGLEAAQDFIRRHPESAGMITVNAWNGWTEGSYLLPDTVNGTDFLRQIRDVWGVDR